MAKLTTEINYATITVNIFYNYFIAYDMLNQLIDNFNLTEKEARVYLANLETGRAKVSIIAKKCGLNRITTYEILKRLAKHGMARSLTIGQIQTFTITDPNQLLTKMERQIEIAKTLLPRLVLLGGPTNQPKVNYFEGVEGIRQIYEATLNCKEKIIYNFAHPQNLLNTVGQDFFNNYVKKRLRRKINVRVLMPNAPENKRYLKESKTSLRQIRFFDGIQFPLPNEILIFDNSVAMLSFTNKIGVLIDDEDISKSMKSIWQMAYNNN